VATDVRLSQNGVEVLSHFTADPDVRLSQAGVEVLSHFTADPDVRLSQLGVEVLWTSTTVAETRLSQLGVEVLSAVGPNEARLSQLGVEALSVVPRSADVRVTHEVIEYAATPAGELRATSAVIEYPTQADGEVRVTHSIIEVIKGSLGPPELDIQKSHSVTFYRGQPDATFEVVVTNIGVSQTNGQTVTVDDTLPTGLTLVSMTGTGWTCVGNVCTRPDILVPGDSYPPITVTVSVALDAPHSMTNLVEVSGGGSLPDSDTDTVTLAELFDAPLWRLYKFSLKTRLEETA
jgi:uncharacterized repeat protein (TIGR01451 family)